MKVKKCIHPRLAIKAMEEFLFFACPNISYGKEILCKITPKMYKLNRNNFCVYPNDFYEDGKDVVRFGYNYSCLFDNSSYGLVIVMSDMNRRASYMRGFSRITKVLLHEMGHLATDEEIVEKYTEAEITRLHEANKRGNYGYIELPDEYAATQWAIDWLKDPNNRKVAKIFEKKFWACFE